jgi:hypothetical protein
MSDPPREEPASKRTGRPRAEQPRSTVAATRLTAPEYDALIRVATRREISVSTLIRQALVRRFS